MRQERAFDETVGEFTGRLLPDGSTLPNTKRSAAEVPPIRDFGKKVEQGKAAYKAKHGNKIPVVH